jgi:hypothetical protein
LAVINNPDVLGLGCDFDKDRNTLNTKRILGLPPLLPLLMHFFDAKKIVSGNCN